MSRELMAFLDSHRVSKGEEFTHTGMGSPTAGRFYIPPEENERLAELVAESFISGNIPTLTEKPPCKKPITVDIDLRYEPETSQKKSSHYHDREVVKELIGLYSGAIRKYVEIPQERKIESYVLQRSAPYEEKEVIKDGIHIVFPDIVTQTEVQHMIRDEVVRKSYSWLTNLPLINGPEEVFDSAVIDRTNWTIFGCSKPEKEPYRLDYIFKEIYDEDTGEYEVKEVPVSRRYGRTLDKDNLKSIILTLLTRRPLSVRGEAEEEMGECFPVREEYREELLSVIRKGEKSVTANKRKPSKLKTQPILPSKREAREAKLEEIREARELLHEVLSSDRATNYKQWIELGWCLFCISVALLDDWIEFSKRCLEKFKEGECERLWENMEDRGMTIRSLRYWARNDNLEKYREKQRKFLTPYLMQSMSGSSQDIADVLYQMYKHQYYCVDGKGDKWYEFHEHRWRESNSGIELRQKLAREVEPEYRILINKLNEEGSDEEAKRLHSVCQKIKDSTQKNKVMAEASWMFYDRDFVSKLDQNPYLVGFENGIYDLKAGEFREGRPEDMVSFSTGHDYEEYPDDHPEVLEVEEFMRKIFPDSELRRYVWDFFASCLQGVSNRERFHIGTGDGGNGKSKLINLFSKAIGDYSGVIPVSLLTGKRAESSKPQPELYSLINRRFGYMQEPSEGDAINSGLMKELSGNDEIKVRTLHDRGTTFKPQLKLMLMCNEKPKLDADDPAVWRRVRVIPFKSRFVENPKRDNPYEHAIDDFLEEKISRWAKPFISMLIKHYEVYKKHGIEEPPEVLKATQEYQLDSDMYMEFVNEKLERKENARLYLDDVYNCFRDWYTRSHDGKVPNRRIFKGKLNNKLQQKLEKNRYWQGWTIMVDEGEPLM